MKLEGKVIIVTGGSGLLGQSIINYLIAEKATVINADIQNGLPDVAFISCDVTDASSMEQLLSTIIERYGRVDGLVNNAYPRTKDWGQKFEDIELASWRKNVDMQLNSVFLCTQVIMRQMKVQGSGSVVNISSIYGTVGPDFSVYDHTEMTMPAAYSAIKGGIVNFTRYMAAYFGPIGIRFNCVSPGGIFDQQNPVFVAQYERKVPMRRMGTPGDIAPAVAFLLSDDAAYITGQNLLVDGGWTAI